MLERETSVSSVAHARLFEPARIGSLLLPNRLIMAPMESNLANRDGTVSDTQMEYYRCRGAGGVGMVIAVPTAEKDQALAFLRDLGENAWVIGSIIAGDNEEPDVILAEGPQ